MGVISVFFSMIFNIITLGFLPAQYQMFDGNIHTHSIPYIGYIPELILNYIAVLFINLSDFYVWIISFIPGVNWIIEWVYRAPDATEHSLEWLFGGMGGHRNFITHSVLNPRFLVFLVLMTVVIIFVSRIKPLKIFVTLLFVGGCLVFISHLLADTMPQSWWGSAHIKVYLFFKFFTLNGFFSKIWLYLNAIIALGIAFMIPNILSDDKKKLEHE